MVNREITLRAFRKGLVHLITPEETSKLAHSEDGLKDQLDNGYDIDESVRDEYRKVADGNESRYLKAWRAYCDKRDHLIAVDGILGLEDRMEAFYVMLDVLKIKYEYVYNQLCDNESVIDIEVVAFKMALPKGDDEALRSAIKTFTLDENEDEVIEVGRKAYYDYLYVYLEKRSLS